jgi:hypothetical protein
VRKTLFQLLVVALVCVLVPAQGLASVMAGQCMSLGHHQDAGHPDAGDDAHDHDGHAKEHDEGKSPHCGPCAACCAVTAITGPAPLVLDAAPAPASYVALQIPPPSSRAATLDRPPLAR